MTVLRWIGRIGAAMVALAVLAVLGVIVLMQTQLGRELVRARVEAKLQATFVGGATVGSIRGTPFTDIVVRDLAIHGPDGKPAIKIGELRVRAALFPLIFHRLVISELVAEDVDVTVKRDAQGELELQRLTGPVPPSTWSVRIASIDVHRAHVRADLGIDAVDLDGIEVAARFDLRHAGPVDAAAAVRATWRQKRAPLALGAALHVDREHVAIPVLLASVANVSLAASGVELPRRAATSWRGDLAVRAPATTVSALLPNLTLPGDVALALAARPEGAATSIAVAGDLGRAGLRGTLRADGSAHSVRGFIGGAHLDLGALSRGRLTGTSNVLAVFDAELFAHEFPRVRAIVQGWGEAGGLPATSAVAAIETEGTRMRVAVGAANAEGLRVGLGAEVRRNGRMTTLERGDVVAMTADAARATDDLAPVRGRVAARLVARGVLAPHVDLSVIGHLDATRLHIRDVAARTLHLRIDAAHVPGHPVGTAHVEVADVTRGRFQLRSATLAARARRDRAIEVSLRAQPGPAPWRFELDALVTPGETIAIELQRHVVQARGGATWQGRTGHIAIAPDKVVVRGLRSSSCDGDIAVDATYVRARRGQGDLTAKLQGTVELAGLREGARGRVTATVDVARHARRWRGSVDAAAAGVALEPRVAQAVDAEAHVRIDRGNLTASVAARTPRAGGAKLALDVAAPSDVADARAWRAVTRNALREVRLQLQGIDVRDAARVAGVDVDPALSGTIDGDVRVRAGQIGGDVRVRGITSPGLRGLGPIAADLRVEQATADELRASASARVEGLGAVALEASLAVPDRVCDPVAWRRLSAGVLRGARLAADDLALDPVALDKLGIASSLRGTLTLHADLEAALRAANVRVDVRGLRGGVLAEPIAAHIEATSDASATRAGAVVQAGGTTLVSCARTPRYRSRS
jgi:hypothetical protein